MGMISGSFFRNHPKGENKIKVRKTVPMPILKLKDIHRLRLFYSVYKIDFNICKSAMSGELN